MTKLLKDSRGRYRTSSLFVEKVGLKQEKYKPLWTLNEEDHHSGLYPSLKAVYLSMADVTEYDFAMHTLKSYPHWLELCEKDWFKPVIDAWRYELELSLKSVGFATIRQIAGDDEDTRSLTAAKYLANAEWKGKESKPTKGRPKTADIVKEAKKIAVDSANIDDDAARLGLTKH